MENTSPFQASQDAPQLKNEPKGKRRDRLRGVPLGMICNIDWALAELGISEEHRAMLRKRKDLPKLCRIGRADIGLSTELAEYLRGLTALGDPPSAERRARRLKRQGKLKQ